MKIVLLSLLTATTLVMAVVQEPIRDAEAADASKQLLQSLGGKLKASIEKHGPVEAIGVCSLEAMPLTQKVAQEKGLLMRRISDKPRNPKNAATDSERALLDEMRADLAKDALKPLYRDEHSVYKPLLIQPLCLVCHGETLTPDVATAIKKTYPADKAVGYQLGQLRGAVKITRKD